MIKRFLFLGLAGGLTLATATAQAQTAVTLGTSPYAENFDNLGTALPAGFSVYTNASTTSLGTAATAAQTILTPSATTTTWTATTGAFKNLASATGLHSPASAATQIAATNRALGVRQTGSFGDAISTATPPTGAGSAFVFQVANTTGKTDFTLSFKLQSLDSTVTRIATWQVDYGTGATPTTFTPVGGTATTGNSTFSNNTLTVSFGSALDNLSGPIYIRIAALNATTGSNNRPTSAIDDFSLSWNTPTANTPNLTVTPSSLAFGSQNTGTTSAAQTYSLSGANLTAATTVTATGPFTVSKDNITFATSLSYTAADLATVKSVYVKFTPTASGAATGSITNVSTGATTRTVALTGIGANPNQTTFDFANCTTALSDGWSQYSVTGAQVWACTAYGRDPNAPTGTAAAPNGVQMNGYANSANVANEDWFISPAFNLTAYNFPLLSFWSRTAFTGPALKLRVSTNYSGTGAPSAATWTDVNVAFPGVGSDTWTQSPSVNLSAFKTANVYVAFVYTSTTAAAARWTLDDIALTNSATAPAPTILTDVNLLAYGYQAINTNGDKTLTVAGADLTGSVTLTSNSTNWTLSKDGVTFASTLTLTQAEVSGTNKAVTVRFRPTVANTRYAGTITVSTPGAAAALTVALTGDTYDLNKTLELVNWNVEWFGSVVSGHGPTDKVLQQTNITTMMTNLNADVYALAEVVDTVRMQNVVTQLSTNTGHPYAFQVSRYGSYGDSPTDPDYVDDQKLVFVYRTDVISNPYCRGLIRCTEAQNCPGYNAWAGGRFPYMMTANVTLDGVTKVVNFVVIHAKANATATSANDYARRALASQLLKTELETNFATGNNIIVGDYNDVLNGTIATGVTPAVSSYNNFMTDTRYLPITLPLANAGLQSTTGFNTVIDNVIANQNMAPYYITGTAAIRTDLAAAITGYATTTSDHYPVFTRYSFANTTTATTSSSRVALGLYPNPVTNAVHFDVPETGSNLSLQVHTIDGRLVLQGTGSAEQLNQQLNQRVGSLGNGLYFIQVVGAKQTYTDRFVKQ